MHTRTVSPQASSHKKRVKNQPLKSPSPDIANKSIIKDTKSPLEEIKKNIIAAQQKQQMLARNGFPVSSHERWDSDLSGLSEFQTDDRQHPLNHSNIKRSYETADEAIEKFYQPLADKYQLQIQNLIHQNKHLKEELQNRRSHQNNDRLHHSHAEQEREKQKNQQELKSYLTLVMNNLVRNHSEKIESLLKESNGRIEKVQCLNKILQARLDKQMDHLHSSKRDNGQKGQLGVLGQSQSHRNSGMSSQNSRQSPSFVSPQNPGRINNAINSESSNIVPQNNSWNSQIHQQGSNVSTPKRYEPAEESTYPRIRTNPAKHENSTGKLSKFQEEDESIDQAHPYNPTSQSQYQSNSQYNMNSEDIIENYRAEVQKLQNQNAKLQRFILNINSEIDKYKGLLDLYDQEIKNKQKEIEKNKAMQELYANELDAKKRQLEKVKFDQNLSKSRSKKQHSEDKTQDRQQQFLQEIQHLRKENEKLSEDNRVLQSEKFAVNQRMSKTAFRIEELEKSIRQKSDQFQRSVQENVSLKWNLQKADKASTFCKQCRILEDVIMQKEREIADSLREKNELLIERKRFLEAIDILNRKEKDFDTLLQQNSELLQERKKYLSQNQQLEKEIALISQQKIKANLDRDHVLQETQKFIPELERVSEDNFRLKHQNEALQRENRYLNEEKQRAASEKDNTLREYENYLQEKEKVFEEEKKGIMKFYESQLKRASQMADGLKNYLSGLSGLKGVLSAEESSKLHHKYECLCFGCESEKERVEGRKVESKKKDSLVDRLHD